MSSNPAAWLEALGTPLVVKEASREPPQADEVTIRAKAVAMNPVDFYRQDTGLFTPTFPTILGCDVAGEVIEVGADVKTFQKGDQVLSLALGALSGRLGGNAFQHHVNISTQLTARFPRHMSYAEASVLPMGITTASACLFEAQHLGLAVPTASPADRDAAVLVWGASSSMGACAVQLARCAGYTVFATASPRNHAFVHALGAVGVFDHAAADAVGDIVAAMKAHGKAFAGVMDAIGTEETIGKCVEVAHRSSGSKRVASVKPEVDIKAPEGVQLTGVYSASIMESHVAGAVFGEFLEKAISDGRIVPRPEPRIVGAGLESINGALDIQRKGVSAQKIVVEL